MHADQNNIRLYVCFDIRSLNNGDGSCGMYIVNERSAHFNTTVCSPVRFTIIIIIRVRVEVGKHSGRRDDAKSGEKNTK